MSSKTFVANLINDNLDIHDKGTTLSGFSSFAPAAADTELAQRRAASRVPVAVVAARVGDLLFQVGATGG